MVTRKINDDITLAYLLKKQENESGDGYCKMSDGTLIQWGSFEYNLTTSDFLTWGNLVYAEVTQNPVFQIPFVDVPCVFAAAGSTIFGWFSSIRPTKTGIPVMSFTRPNAYTGTIKVCWQAVGRWK